MEIEFARKIISRADTILLAKILIIIFLKNTVLMN